MSATLKVIPTTTGPRAERHAIRASSLAIVAWKEYTAKSQKKASKISLKIISFDRGARR
jgi:hypothetical protein